MTDREFDLLLRSALLERNREELEDAAHLDPIEPSPRYLRWRMKFLADPFRYGKKHTRPLWRKVLRVALSAVLVIVLTFGAVLAVYPPARQWVARWFETYTVFSFSSESNYYRTPGRWYPDYLPEGFELEAEEVKGVLTNVIFSNDSGTKIYLRYSSYEYSDFTADNEHQTYKEIMLTDDIPAVLLEASTSDNYNYLIWNDENTQTAFRLISTLDVQELISIAQSVKQEH